MLSFALNFYPLSDNVFQSINWKSSQWFLLRRFAKKVREKEIEEKEWSLAEDIGWTSSAVVCNQMTAWVRIKVCASHSSPPKKRSSVVVTAFWCTNWRSEVWQTHPSRGISCASQSFADHRHQIGVCPLLCSSMWRSIRHISLLICYCL
jgi:hypothetical protein